MVRTKTQSKTQSKTSAKDRRRNKASALSGLRRSEELIIRSAAMVSYADASATMLRINAALSTLLAKKKDDELRVRFASEKKTNDEQGNSWSVFTTSTGAPIGGVAEFSHHWARSGVMYKGVNLMKHFCFETTGKDYDFAELGCAQYGAYNFATDEWIWRYNAMCTDPATDIEMRLNDDLDIDGYQLKFKGTDRVLGKGGWYTGNIFHDITGFTCVFSK